MLEPEPFTSLGAIASDLTAAVYKEVYQQGLWTGYASPKLRSQKRRTVVLRRFPSLPVDKGLLAAKGLEAYFAPREWRDQCVDTPNWTRMPQTVALIQSLMVKHGWTKLGIVVVSELEPDGKLAEHSDEGEYFEGFHRVHIPLESGDGCHFIIDGEDRLLSAGEVWIIDNKRKHSVHNTGKSNRVNLYFDAI